MFSHSKVYSQEFKIKTRSLFIFNNDQGCPERKNHLSMEGSMGCGGFLESLGIDKHAASSTDTL